MKMNIAEHPPGAIPLKSPHKSGRSMLPRFEEIPTFLPAHLRERLKTFKVPATEAILRKEARALKKAKVVNEAKAQKASMYSARVERAKALRAEYRTNFTLIGGACSFHVEPVKLPESLKNRLAALEEKSRTRKLPKNILAKEEAASKRRLENLKRAKERRTVHFEKVKRLRRVKGTKPRYDNVSTALPHNLQLRLASYRQPTAKTILRKEERATRRRLAAVQMKQRKAKFHNDTVFRAKKTRNAFRENFELLGSTNKSRQPTTSVPLPPRLAKRLENLSKKYGNKSAKQILDHEDAVLKKKRESIKEKVAGVRAHSHIVAQRMQAKRLVQRYEGGYTHLPERLQRIIGGYKRLSNKALLDREAKANLRRQQFLANRRALASVDAKLNAAKSRKQSYTDNGCYFTHGQHEPIILPKRLKERLDRLQKPLDAKSIIAKEELVIRNSQRLREEKVSKLQKHAQVVTERKAKNSREARYDAVADFLPKRLKNRLHSYTRPTARTILLTHARVGIRRALKIQATVQRLKRHSEDVARVKKSQKELILLLCHEPEKVKLPSHLEERLKLFKRPEAEAIMRKEQHAYENKDKLLRAKSQKASEHYRRALELKSKKFKVPRFDTAPEFLPARLKQRLQESRRDSPARFVARFQRTVKRGELLQQARICTIEAHMSHVKAVQDRNVEFRQNFDILGSSDKVELPTHLVARLELLQQKHHGHTPEKILEKEKKVKASREATISSKKSACREHLAVVEKRKVAKRSQKASC